MDQISPDIEQWLLMDAKVRSRWRNVCQHVGLAEYVFKIEREKNNMEMVLVMWKEKKPDTYTVNMLKTVLAVEVCLLFIHAKNVTLNIHISYT